MKTFANCAGIILVLICFVASEGVVEASPLTGEYGVLRSDLPESTFIPYTESTLDDFCEVVRIRDEYGLQEILNSDRGFFVASGIRVLVIDSTFGKRKIRILEGPNAGSAGWILMEWVVDE